MPFGKNSCLTALRHFPRWHQLACTSLTESAQVFAQFCCSYLLPGCLINALHFLSQPSVLYLLPSSPIHPEVDNGPGELRSPQDRCGVGTLSLLESSYAASPLKYGAGWKKEELQEKDFRDYSLVLVHWRTSYRFLIDRSLRWYRKRIVWAAKRRVWRFPVSLLAKFCVS